MMRDFAYSCILVQGPMCKDATNTETVLFTMFFAYVFFGRKDE